MAERKVLEFFIENTANIISIATNMPREIQSPSPNSGFIYENEDEKMWLEESKGILIKIPNQPSVLNENPIPIHDFVDNILDRIRWSSSLL